MNKAQKERANTLRFKISVERNIKIALVAMLVVYEKQTDDEQALRETRLNNSVGFNSNDAEILSSFSEQVLKGWHLTEAQLKFVFKKMPKYSGQVVCIIEDEGDKTWSKWAEKVKQTEPRVKEVS